MADRLEEYLRRMLEGPPAPAKRPEPRREALEAEVLEVVEAPEPQRRPLQREIEENLGSDALSSGRIDEEEPSEAETPAPEGALAALDIAQLLRSPQRLREAIVAGEILRRPDW
jgi:hypothetical protein